jgi:hypothetical protein
MKEKNYVEMKTRNSIFVVCFFTWSSCRSVLIFQVYLNSAEGQRYAAFYNVSDWPYVAVIDPRTGESLRVWNKIDGSSFCDTLLEFLCQQQSLQIPQKRLKLSNSPMAARVCWDFFLTVTFKLWFWILVYQQMCSLLDIKVFTYEGTQYMNLW